MNTFGVYQTEYQIGFLSSSSPSAISWIGSIQAFLLMLVGAATGPVYDAGYFRELLLGGSFLVVFGHMMLSLCTKYWQVLLAQAFCIGVGTGFLFVPGVAILSTYFNSRLALTTGLAASGSSLGKAIFPHCQKKRGADTCHRRCNLSNHTPQARP
jgi:MFS family permease